MKLLKHLTLLFFTPPLQKTLHTLSLQNFLLYHGVGIRTQVLDVENEGCPLKDYVSLRIKAMLRVKGKMVCRSVYTLLKEKEIPAIGDRVVIRYSPKDLPNAIVIASKK